MRLLRRRVPTKRLAMAGAVLLGDLSRAVPTVGGSANVTVHPSMIHWILSSPADYHYRVHHPSEETPAMLFGLAVDAYLFGTGDARHETLKPARLRDARDCAEAIRANPAAAAILAAGEAQVPLRWVDEETGLECSGRPDFLSPQSGLVVDLKTTSGGLDLWALGSTVAKWGYHLQIAMYRMGLRANGVDLMPAFIFVRSTPPYDSRVVTMTPDQVADSERDVRRLLKIIARCDAAGIWPGVSDAVDTLALPPHAFQPTIGEDDT
jgi:hypothetical protein